MTKTFTFMLALAFSSGCVAAQYNPVIFNLSTLLDFNPVKGPVKSLQTTVDNSDGNQVYRMAMTLEPNGCIQSLDVEDMSQKFTLHVVKKADALSGEYSGQPVTFTLDKKCNIAAKKVGEDVTHYTHYPNGMIKDIVYKGMTLASHFYDKQNNLIKVEFYMSGKVASANTIVYRDSEHRPVDYALKNQSVYAAGYTASSQCEYAQNSVPTLCHIAIIPEGNEQRPNRLISHTQAEFYH